MSKILFQKWQGAGNDFIIIDNRTGVVNDLNTIDINKLCDRHFGIGADGLMLIGLKDGYDFEMVFFNSDGNPAEMCGNGGRCIAAMAARSGIFKEKAVFLTTDGPHEAVVVSEEIIRLKMASVKEITRIDLPPIGSLSGGAGWYLNTGVPHLVVFVEHLDSINVDLDGRALRNFERFSPAGTNVNFVRIHGETLVVRTYERGVEAETLACGTGNVAAAIAAYYSGLSVMPDYRCQTLGGVLKVNFNHSGSMRFEEVWLEGPAVRVFDGSFDV